MSAPRGSSLPPKGRLLTREHRALCLLARPTPPVTLSEIPGDLDWDALASLAVHHNLAPLLFTNLRTRGMSGAVPAAVLARLERDYHFSLALTTTLQAAFSRIADGLEETRIGWMPLKGVLFGRTLYGSPDVRPMSDLDFLVREADMEAASAILERLGYARSVPPARRATHDTMFERHYARTAGAFIVRVEPHSGLGQAARYRVDAEGLWARSVPVSRYGVADWGSSARALSPEDTLAHLFLHQANAVFDEIDLRSTLDVHEVVAQWRPVWAQVLARARSWRVATPMAIALGSARSLLGTPVPDEVLAEVRPGPLRRRWLGLFVDPDLGLYRRPSDPRWLKRLTVGFGTMDRPGDALRYAGSYAALRLRDVRARGKG